MHVQVLARSTRRQVRLVQGANIAGFEKVAEAMMAQGLV